MIEIKIKITDEIGIHARPATVLVNEAAKYIAKLEIGLVGKDRMNLKSIMGVMSLGAGKDSELIVSASGIDAEEAIAAIKQIFISENLGVIID